MAQWPFRRQNQSQLPPTATQFNQPHRRWPMIAASVVAALILVGLAVLAGILIYNAVHKEPTKKSNVATNNQSQSQKKPAAGSPKPSSGSGGTSGTTGGTTTGPNSSTQKKSTTGSSSSSAPSSASSSAATSGSQVGKTLPNNGPGDVIALFAGSSLAAAGLHYVLNLRREN